jgi:hypothetical protein
MFLGPTKTRTVKMEWRSATRDTLPVHHQEVLISVRGIYYLTQYDEKIKVFRMVEDPDNFFGLDDDLHIYWLPIIEPDRMRDSR